MTHFYRPDGSIKYTEYTPEESDDRQRIRDREERIQAASERLNTFIEDIELCPDHIEYIVRALTAKKQ